ncbi:hypothetical protein [Mucilaginibacter sp.]|uniref:hypothetical protein n=1 Tax=Mucilaginibacter sp. TaxID=1882438 RepID=UPI00262E2603|nr:hypothetical protein [Mucilaginibacter sp.]MDB4919370.1 hypothetical protein [Mucilaginibacter sp.]
MVTTIKKELTDLQVLKGKLLVAIEKKIIGNQVAQTNWMIDNWLKIEYGSLKDLLNSIENRLRKCEVIYFTYFENINHSVLDGSSADLPVGTNALFYFGTNQLKSVFEVNDAAFYKELIDINFQTYILSLATLFENIVRLVEILIKKIILHIKGKRPTSSPLTSFLDHYDSLISLEYKKEDDLYKCFILYEPFFKKYLITINELRNRYIHGYQTYLGSSDEEYKIIEKFDDKQFSKNSPELNVDEFIKATLNMTKNLVADLLNCLTIIVEDPVATIPA